MASIGIEDVSLALGYQGNVLLQQMAPVSTQFGTMLESQTVHQLQQQQQQQQQQAQQPIVRSPTSTQADEESMMKMGASSLAAAYRARIALAAGSPAPTASQAPGQARTTPAARLLTFVNSPLPTPTVHISDLSTVQALEKKWKSLYGSMRNNSQVAADVLMKQAQATSQLEELVQLLLIQLKAGVEERARLQQVVLQERSQLMAQAEEAQQLQTRLHHTEHWGTAAQVVTESLQGQLTQAREALEVSNRERQQLAEQAKQLTEQLSVTTECRTRGDALIAEQNTVIETLRQQLQEQASTSAALAEDKSALELQLQGVLRAEQELTVHLRETHAAIEGQLAALRDQLKTERQKRAAVVKRRGELAAQVEALQATVAAQQAEMAALAERLSRSGGTSSQHSGASRPSHSHGHPTTTSTRAGALGGGPSSTSRSTTPVASSVAAHAAHARVTAAVSSLTATAAAVAFASGQQPQPQRTAVRALVRPGSAGNGTANARHGRSSSSPSTSGGGVPSGGGSTGGTARAARRSVSPGPRSMMPPPVTAAAATAAAKAAADELSDVSPAAETPPAAAAATAVTFHVPSSLPPMETTSIMTPPPKLYFDDIGEGPASARGGAEAGDGLSQDGTPMAADAAGPLPVPQRLFAASMAGGRLEPPSPPINLLPVAGARSVQRPTHGDQNGTGSGGGAGTNRRRSLSPEPSRAGMNAAQHARRGGHAGSAAAGPGAGAGGAAERGGRAGGTRVAGPGAPMVNTWLP